MPLLHVMYMYCRYVSLYMCYNCKLINCLIIFPVYLFRIDGDDQADLSDSALCVDPEYSMLWAYNTRKGILSCYNPITAEVKGQHYLACGLHVPYSFTKQHD